MASEVRLITTHDMDDRIAEMCEVGRIFGERGWLAATAGNLSARLGESHLLITASGCFKTSLDRASFVVVGLDGSLDPAGKRPSAETDLHRRIYQRCPLAGAVVHIHSVNATLISRVRRAVFTAQGYEMAKALEGVDTPEDAVSVPIFPNDQDIPGLAARVDAYLDEHPGTIGYLLESHGLYTWGRTMADARRHTEALEFLFACEMELARLRSLP